VYTPCRLLAYQNRRRNELQLLLPPPTAYGVYAISYLFIALCFYMILLHGLKFSPSLELAWIIASIGRYFIVREYLAKCCADVNTHAISSTLLLSSNICTAVSIVQDLLVQQFLNLAFKSAFRQLFIPAMTPNVVDIQVDTSNTPLLRFILEWIDLCLV
jgi:hypothetical protein